ncbi:hypothetical protein AYM40_22390 [Paraburkholderia phytofirmans OLGA172]|uniref:DUF2069 domain-containing protein n=1 Tax=Paraburkholderia phytofirmans OLGA172 TaxID=1417228 RepID=A0A167W9X4_9BURK|nr:hypothetical protein [Paraburkholderia phytofirmans]ANB75167.1 hypothetical protein AYM40_22390 [Paraburkholderia phytofirmans OLGA172]
MTAMPRCIRVSLIGFFLAFLCEAWVEIALLQSGSLPWEGCLAVFASFMANPLALVYGIKRKRWAYDLLKWIAAFSLVWTISGHSYLQELGLWAIALITLCVWLRLGALLILRRKAVKDWIEATTAGDGLQGRG